MKIVIEAKQKIGDAHGIRVDLEGFDDDRAWVSRAAGLLGVGMAHIAEHVLPAEYEDSPLGPYVGLAYVVRRALKDADDVIAGEAGIRESPAPDLEVVE